MKKFTYYACFSDSTASSNCKVIRAKTLKEARALRKALNAQSKTLRYSRPHKYEMSYERLFSLMPYSNIEFTRIGSFDR